MWISDGSHEDRMDRNDDSIRDISADGVRAKADREKEFVVPADDRRLIGVDVRKGVFHQSRVEE